MRRLSASSIPFRVASFALFALPFVSIAASAQTGTDTVAVERADTSTTKGRVRISIDERGISVEGDARVERRTADEDGKWVEIYDGRGRYKERGPDVIKFGESLLIERDEQVSGSVVVFGGNAIIEGRVTGSVNVFGGDLRVRSGAEIRGDAVVIGGELEEDDDVVIRGERVEIARTSFITNAPGWLGAAVSTVLFFVGLILCFLVVLFLRDRVSRAHEHLASSYLKCFGAGLLTVFIGFFGILMVVTLLVITFVGIPLAALVLISCVGVTIIAATVFNFGIGGLLAGKLAFESESAFTYVFLGALLVALPGMVSFALGVVDVPLAAPLRFSLGAFGCLLFLFGVTCGLGALVLSRFGSRSLPEDNPPPQGHTSPSAA